MLVYASLFRRNHLKKYMMIDKPYLVFTDIHTYNVYLDQSLKCKNVFLKKTPKLIYRLD